MCTAVATVDDIPGVSTVLFLTEQPLSLGTTRNATHNQITSSGKTVKEGPFHSYQVTWKASLQLGL